MTLHEEYGNIIIVTEWIADKMTNLLEEVRENLKTRGTAASWETRNGLALLAEVAGKHDILVFLNGEEPQNGEALLNEVTVKQGDIVTIASLGRI